MEDTPVILFDGVCNLCNGAVNFIIRRDVKKKFRFAALQSEAGKKMHSIFLTGNSIESIVLISGAQVYYKSAAALQIARLLPLPWRLLYGFIIVPAFIRNAVYNFIARNRYKWFGKKERCMLPTREVLSRFLQ